MLPPQKVGMWGSLSRIPNIVAGRTSSTGSLAATLVLALGGDHG